MYEEGVSEQFQLPPTPQLVLIRGDLPKDCHPMAYPKDVAKLVAQRLVSATFHLSTQHLVEGRGS